MTEIEQKRHEWWTTALKSSLNWIPAGTCHKCGKYRACFISYPEHTFTCVICTAEKLFPDSPEPNKRVPSPDLKYGGVVLAPEYTEEETDE